jgi:uncharacterized protein YnzC (UPF0291/DUF896 family)
MGRKRINVLSEDERYQEDIEQVQFLMKWAEKKENKKVSRKKYMDEFKDEFRDVFRSSTKN